MDIKKVLTPERIADILTRKIVPYYWDVQDMLAEREVLLEALKRLPSHIAIAGQDLCVGCLDIPGQCMDGCSIKQVKAILARARGE